MSDERFEQDEKQDDVDAHRRHSNMRKVEAKDEAGTPDSDDVEAHRRHSNLRNAEAKDEAGSDDSDDVEAHRRNA
jgi:hypothetical protein